MEWNKQKIKGLLLVVCGGVAFLLRTAAPGCSPGGAGLAAWDFGAVSAGRRPGLYPECAHAGHRAAPVPQKPEGRKAPPPLALVLTLVAVIGVLALAGLVIGPGIADAVMSIIREIPAAFQRLEHQLTALAENLQDLWPLLEEQLMKLQEEIQWQELSAKALEIAKAIGAGIVSSGGFIGGVVSGVSTFVISLIFSFYVLLQKEKLGRQARQVIYGLLPLRQADRTLDVLRLSGRTFSSFLSGQCLEACILGTLFVAAMTIFRMPYALLVGVLIALTALIPIVGAFIGCAVGALLIAIDDPWKALWFIVLFLVLQQMEGNLIYPPCGGLLRGAALHLGAGRRHSGRQAHGDHRDAVLHPAVLRDLRPVPQLCEKPAGEQGSPTGEMAGPASPTLPAVSVLSAALHLFKNRPSNWAAGFVRRFQFFIDKNPCQCYAIFDKNNCHFDLDHCQERG